MLSTLFTRECYRKHQDIDNYTSYKNGPKKEDEVRTCKICHETISDLKSFDHFFYGQKTRNSQLVFISVVQSEKNNGIKPTYFSIHLAIRFQEHY
ncbi:MAG: hypothetical protein BAJALOKI2v1_30002 [Promethearchaeota archaeon]|nr:MAG: hypothetical protein BAJALOKI2v1_30002 [Candidatus Lokiarchaeota archaeon]